MKTIVGLFDNYSDAQSAVSELEAAGFDRDSISVFANRGDQPGGGSSAASTESGSDTAERTMAGAVAGGGVGLLAGLALAMIAGVGPILAGGPLAAGLTGAGIGAVAGGMVGALPSAGVPEEHAHYYAEGVRRGGTLVTLACDDEDAKQAMDILNRHNPVDIDQRSRQWQAGGWQGVTPDLKRSPALTQYHDRSPSFAADRMDDTPLSAAPAGPGGQTTWNEFGAETDSGARS